MINCSLHRKNYRLIYLGTPNGSLLMYDPATGEVVTVRTDMPSDPNDPDRQNDIDPVRRSRPGKGE